MNIATYQIDGFEADDVIGTMAQQAEKEGFEVFMATPDKDYGQLVTDRIHMFRPRHTGGFELMGPTEVCAKYGLASTEQVIDLLALMGDASDNIPGCKGVGEKTAVSLLQQFGSVDNLLAHTDLLKGALRQKVESQTEEIRFSRFLATIRTDVPVSFHADEVTLRPRNDAELSDIYRRLEFNTLLKNLSPSIQNNPITPSPSKKAKSTDPAQLDLFAVPEAPTTNDQRRHTIPSKTASAPIC